MTHPSDIAGLSERLREMPSSLNDACRKMDEAATALDSLSARVKELEGELVDAQVALGGVNSDWNTAMARALRAEQERDEAIAALKPFAEFDHATTSDKPDACVIARGRVPSTLTLAHFDAARDLVRRLAGPEKEGK